MSAASILSDETIDIAIVEFVNQLVGRSEYFDRLVVLISGNNLFKGGALISLLFFVWFSSRPCSRERTILMLTVLAAPVAVLVARLLALNLPFRLRPLHNDALDLELPYGVTRGALDGWSSFPSDHAVLFFSVAIGIFLASRRAGILAIIYTALFIALPRVYTGFHYPSDLLAGAVVGTLFTIATVHYLRNSHAAAVICGWSETHAGYFYTAMFFICHQIANLFVESREIAENVARAVLKLVRVIF